MPETAGDFERLVVATPNDSLVWVKFMAFKLSLADVEVSATYIKEYFGLLALLQCRCHPNTQVIVLFLCGVDRQCKKRLKIPCPSVLDRSCYS